MAAGGIGVSGLGLLLLLFFGGGFVGSVDVVPLPEDPVVAQVAPAECLFYSSWTGKTKASPDGISSTERLFSDPEFVDYLKHVDGLLHQAVSQGMVSQGVGKEHLVAGFYLLEHLQSHAGSLYVSSVNAQDKQIVGGLIVRFEEDELDTLVASLEALLKFVPAEYQSSVEIEGTKFSRIDIGMPVVWVVKENYLVVGLGEGEAKNIVKRLGGTVPDWLVEAKKAVEVPRPANFVHVDVPRVFLTVQDSWSPSDALLFAGVREAFGLNAIESFLMAGVEINYHGTLPSVGLARPAPLLVGGMMPAVGGARNAARANLKQVGLAMQRTTQSMNNLKQIGLAMHNFHSTHGAFPAGYSADENGKPLLSWRVHILPFIEGGQLYEQFHLDEPWDSPHNKELIAKMPEVYKLPKSKAEQGKTVYLGVGGADGVFIRPRDGNHLGTGMRDITDGTSNTIMTVEVSDARAIEWTRPGDFAPKKEDPRKGLSIDPQRGMSVGFTDGSVRNIGKDIAKETLMKLFTKSGGEIVEVP